MYKTFFISILLVLSLKADKVSNFNLSTQNLANSTLITKEPIEGLVVDQILVDTLISGWGFKYWKWGTESEYFHTEDWFEQDSQTGGSDKTGHFYMTYLLSRVLAGRMEDRGYTREEASLFGSISGMLSMTLLEVGDGTSAYGFSKEDLLSDFIGSSLAYLTRVNPKIDEFVDIRLEYLPTSNYIKGGDNTTDYSGMRHLLAFKMSGFEELKHTYWSLFEFQVGYYARGYRSIDTEPRSQHLYAGVGISLSNLAKRSEVNILKNLFEFYQPGHTYIDSDIWSR